jgi:hypothetical protein
VLGGTKDLIRRIVMRKKNKLVHGVGINDAPCQVKEHALVDGKWKMIWTCPFYETWKGMLKRCYSAKYQEKLPTYKGCSVAEEWLTFSKFKSWMETQDWEGKHLDKDLLKHGNKVYGSEYCIFVSPQVNCFMTECTSLRGEWPIGVYWNKEKKKFRSRCCNPFTKKEEHLGYFTCPDEAHRAWLKRKREHAITLAALQTDPRVAKALIDRYNVEVYNPLHEQEIE